MKVYTPQISWHDRQSILSVDFQNRPFSEDDPFTRTFRLATGGNDSHVIVWKVSVLNNPESKKPIDSIECLAELTQHQRSVNIVRFSPNLKDNFLASGDDDSLIFIWKLCEKDLENVDSNEMKPVGNLIDTEVISIETWKTYKILRGHNQDVSDLCWSQDGQKLVSGSVDNNVFVWDVHRGSKLHKVAKEHFSYVQGVTWDPLNLYIASLSADRNMVLFNAKNGKTVHRISKLSTEQSDKSSKLFYDQTLMSFCRRLTFSPGGELLFAPSGIYESSPDNIENTVYIFERDSLNRPSFYLPTGKFSVAVKCCPVVFELKENIENVFKIIFAVATQDSLLFYDSQQLSPFAYVSQIHYLRLTDISWSADGRILIVTSTDGFSTFITFDKEELGTVYTGKLLELNELEPGWNQQRATLMKFGSAEKQKIIKPTICTTPITAFFKKAISPSMKVSKPTSASSTIKPTTESINENDDDDVRIIEPTSQNVNQNKPGRRVSLITLFTPKNSSNGSSTVNESIKLVNNNGAVVDDCKNVNQIETGVKRKRPEEECETPTTANSSQSSLNLN